MTLTIEQGTWSRFEKPGYPEDITTGGMGPCTGVIVFDPESGVTFGAHLTVPHTHEADQLAEMLNNAATAFARSSLVLIWISGCCDDKSRSGREQTQIRRYVEDQVRGAFPCNATVEVRWPRAGTTAVSMTLDPDTGAFFLD